MTEYRIAKLEDAEIAYLDEGQGEICVLIHGFGSNAVVNWASTSWIATLTGAGRRVVAFDNRGHGRSSKFYDPACYRAETMAGDALALMDRLGIERADVIGYSMGGRIGAAAGLAAPGRVRSLVMGGIGASLVEGNSRAEEIAAALEADVATGRTGAGATYRRFAERTGSDLKALAACMRGQLRGVSLQSLAGLTMPVLIATGAADEVAGNPELLAAAIPGAEVLSIPGRDHMLATGDPLFKRRVLDFLGLRS
jgi:pimeloyl-ACP methyl ester carboxylesterase